MDFGKENVGSGMAGYIVSRETFNAVLCRFLRQSAGKFSGTGIVVRPNIAKSQNSHRKFAVSEFSQYPNKKIGVTVKSA